MIDSIKQHTNTTTLRQAFHAYYDQSELKPRTRDEYAKVFDHWEALTDDPDIQQINNLTLTKFKTAFLQKLSPSTFNKARAHIMAVLNRLAPKGKTNPGGLAIIPDFVYVPRAKEPEKLPRVATDAELGAIYQAAAEATWPRFEFGAGAWWQALLVFLFNTGLRRNDVFNLRMQDLDLDNHAFQFRAEKTGKLRVLPLHPTAVEHLQKIWSERELVFPKSKGVRILYQHWHSIQDAAGLPRAQHLTFHQLRSTCGSRLFQQSPGAAQEMLGHSSIDTTRRSYANLSEHLRELATQSSQPAAFQPQDPPDHDPDILRFPA